MIMCADRCRESRTRPGDKTGKSGRREHQHPNAGCVSGETTTSERAGSVRLLRPRRVGHHRCELDLESTRKQQQQQPNTNHLSLFCFSFSTVCITLESVDGRRYRALLHLLRLLPLLFLSIIYRVYFIWHHITAPPSPPCPCPLSRPACIRRTQNLTTHVLVCIYVA